MRAIWKTTLEVKDGAQITGLPAGATCVHVAMQGGDVFSGGEVTLWWDVPDIDRKRVARTLIVVGTGHPIQESGDVLATEYRGTVIACEQPPLVFHVLEQI